MEPNSVFNTEKRKEKCSFRQQEYLLIRHMIKSNASDNQWKIVNLRLGASATCLPTKNKNKLISLQIKHFWISRSYQQIF